MTSDPFVRAMLSLATGLLIIVLALTVWSTANSRNFASTNERLDRIEQRLVFQSCLLLYEPADRDNVTIAECGGE